MLYNKKILKKINLDLDQESALLKYLFLLKKHNNITNLVGSSTINKAWERHVLDSLQILKFIKNKNCTILDMGTGAGLPGAILNIAGCKNITLVDSNVKKIKFLNTVKNEMNLSYKLILERIEKIDKLKFDVIVSRALANLNNLFSYSHKFVKKNTVLIFLKGKTVNEEISGAKIDWSFTFEKHQSITSPEGALLVITKLDKII